MCSDLLSINRNELKKVNLNKQRTCEICNKSIKKRIVKFTNIEQDIPIHYFCSICCKFKWLDKESKEAEILKWSFDWYQIEQEYIGKIFKIIRKYKKAYKINKKIKKG